MDLKDSQEMLATSTCLYLLKKYSQPLCNVRFLGGYRARKGNLGANIRQTRFQTKCYLFSLYTHNIE